MSEARDEETTVVAVRRDPSDPTFWIPTDPEKRAKFARALADVVGETDVTSLRRRDIPSQRMWAGSGMSRPNRRRKSR